MSRANILPRLIRLQDALDYLGIDRHRLNEQVCPNLDEIPISNQGMAFDRLDLDTWGDDYIIVVDSLRHPSEGV